MGDTRIINSSQLWDEVLLDESNYIDDQNVVKNRISTVKKWVQNADVILNIGAGQGYIENYEHNINFQKWLSMDISLEGLKKLKNKINNTNIGFIEANILTLPINTSTVDALICMEVIEHIDKKLEKRVFSELKRVINETGRLIITVPIFEPRALKCHPVGHLRKFTHLSAMNMINSNGLKITNQAKIFAFKNNYRIKSVISNRFNLRRPSVLVVECRK